MDSETSQEVFFQSVRNALGRGFSIVDLYWTIAILALCFGFGFLMRRYYENRFEIRRRVQHTIRFLLGKQVSLQFRRRVKFTVFIVSSQTGAVLERHKTHNVSAGGMFIRTPNPFELNSSFHFILKLPNNSKIHGTALVRWIHKLPSEWTPQGMGCEFVGLTTEDINQIRLALRKS